MKERGLSQERAIWGLSPNSMTDTSRTQSYANHGHRPVWTYIAGVFGGAAFVMLAEAWLLGRNTAALGSVLLAVAVLALVSISRVYTVRLQNRIIRLEMRLRLRDVLPAVAARADPRS